ncbi:MAG: hypothetical protein ACE5GS_10540 [Kiloniellaceae bacterium]
MSSLPEVRALDDTGNGPALSGPEPRLEELLDEPVVRVLMARDGVTRGDLDRLIGRLRRDRSLRARGGGTSAMAAVGPGRAAASGTEAPVIPPPAPGRD